MSIVFLKKIKKFFSKKTLDNWRQAQYNKAMKERRKTPKNQKGKTMLNRDIFAGDIIMTVKELKTILEKYEDNDNVYLIGLDDDCAVLRINEDNIAET